MLDPHVPSHNCRQDVGTQPRLCQPGGSGPDSEVEAPDSKMHGLIISLDSLTQHLYSLLPRLPHATEAGPAEYVGSYIPAIPAGWL